ncbi:MAG: hypothetical protein LH629_12480 [Ignavibacteria bacterium]|nr:hypothetical protein [Ignavibacteria bacterium]
MRKIEYYDSVIPSGNSVMLKNLHLLYLINSNKKYLVLSENLKEKIFNTAISFPSSFSNLLIIILSIHKTTDEITVCNKKFEKDLQMLNKIYLPFCFIIPMSENNNKYSITLGKIQKEKPEYYWCKNYSCKPPFTSLNNLIQNLSN